MNKAKGHITQWMHMLGITIITTLTFRPSLIMQGTARSVPLSNTGLEIKLMMNKSTLRVKQSESEEV